MDYKQKKLTDNKLKILEAVVHNSTSSMTPDCSTTLDTILGISVTDTETPPRIEEITESEVVRDMEAQIVDKLLEIHSIGLKSHKRLNVLNLNTAV